MKASVALITHSNVILHVRGVGNASYRYSRWSGVHPKEDVPMELFVSTYLASSSKYRIVMTL
jgi:hypothetical protein